MLAVYGRRCRMVVERERNIMAENAYYIEPIGTDTNERLFRDLVHNREENVLEEHTCADGVKRNLLQVSVRELANCIICRTSSKLTFDVFVETAKGTQPIQVVFSEKVEKALKGKIPLDKAEVTIETIMKLLLAMPIHTKSAVQRTAPLPKPRPSLPGVPLRNAKQPQTFPIRISNR